MRKWIPAFAGMTGEKDMAKGEEKPNLVKDLVESHSKIAAAAEAAQAAGDHEAHAAIHAALVSSGDLVWKLKGCAKYLKKYL
jgi:hypothetical protein